MPSDRRAAVRLFIAAAAAEAVWLLLLAWMVVR
jgi:hypothetical protein